MGLFNRGKGKGDDKAKVKRLETENAHLRRQLAAAQKDQLILDYRDATWDPTWDHELRGRKVHADPLGSTYREMIKKHMRADGIDI